MKFSLDKIKGSTPPKISSMHVQPEHNVMNSTDTPIYVLSV